ncbi:MAG: hypothetical protein AAGG51_05180 [Cyanobacteria bacterium P01_G01_bin.54]
MTPNLNEMTNTELKRYISKHRNDTEAFSAGLGVILSRLEPANFKPPEQAEAELKALLAEQQQKWEEGDR